MKQYYCIACNKYFEGFTELIEHAVFDHEQKGEKFQLILKILDATKDE